MLLFAAGALPPSLGAQNRDEIEDILVEGAPRVERGQILSGISSRVGEPLDVEKVTEDIKKIFALGFFQDVRAEFETRPGGRVALIFRVSGRPRMAKVDIVGVTLVGASDLEKAFLLKAGTVYAPGVVEATVENLRKVYRDKGYFKVKIRPQVDPLPGNRVNVTLVVVETPRLYITEIRAPNTTVFNELEIKRMMSTAEVDCFDWVNDSGVFDEMKINQDLQVISSKYLALGYLRVFIEKPKVRVLHTGEFSRIFVSLTIREGQRYFTGKLEISGDLLGKKSDLLDAMALKPGRVFDPFRHNRDLFLLREIYQEQGYAFARALPQVNVNDQTRIVDVTYRMLKGDKAYIGRIEFQGNRETRDYVMRREFEVRENELFNGKNLRVSQENLTRLGFFSPGLRVERQPAEVDNVLDIVTKVEETQTGTAQASVGLSDQSGFTTSLSISKGNLFGRGQTVRLTATAGQKAVKENYRFDFVDPHLFDSEVSSDTSLNKSTTADASELDRGDITELQVSQGLGFPLLPLLKWNFSLNLTKRDFERPVSEPRNLRKFTNSLIYNSVNHPIFPTTGMRLIFSITQVGGQVLGGDTEFRTYRFRGRRFFALNPSNNLILMTRLRLGWIQQVGEHVIPLEDRFRLGGIASLHGYNFGEIGGPYGILERRLNSDQTQALDDHGDPVVTNNGDPVKVLVDRRTLGLNDDLLTELRSGGTQERLFNVEFLFPLAGENLRGVVFYDAGNVSAEARQYEILQEERPGTWSLLQSVGFGIRMITPLGVFRFEYGNKLNPEPGESGGKFDFTISSLF